MATELPSGVIAMGARSYVPELGRYLQTDPRPGGSANAYAYVFGNPVNETDPTGEYTWGFSASLTSSLDNQGAEILAAYEASVRAEEERIAEEAAAEARAYAGMEAIGSEEWGEEEEWWEEEGEEYAAYHPGEGKQANPLVESGVFFRQLSGEGSGGSINTLLPEVVRLCVERRDEQACIRYADFLGIEKVAGEVAKEVAKGAKSVWKTVKKWVGRHAKGIKSALCHVTGWGSGTLAGAGAGLITGGPENPFSWVAAGTVGYAVGSGVEYACDH